MGHPPPPRAAPTLDLVAAQIGALVTLISAVRASARAAGMPPSVVMGLDAMSFGGAEVLADAQAAAATRRDAA